MLSPSAVAQGQKARRLLTSETHDFRRFAGTICQHAFGSFFLAHSFLPFANTPALLLHSPPIQNLATIHPTWLCPFHLRAGFATWKTVEHA